MKRLLPFTCLCLFACSKPPEQKAKDLIAKELNLTLHDFKSYEPVQFGKLDSSFTSLDKNEDYEASINRMEEIVKELKEMNQDMDIYGSLWSSYRLEQETRKFKRLRIEFQYNQYLSDSISNAFRQQFKGWQMKHSFRAKNLAGNVGIQHRLYQFDSSLMRITGQEDISESARNN